MVLVVRHDRVFVPDANNDGVLGPGHSGAATPGSGQVCSIGLWVVLCHNELLVAHPDACRSGVPLALGDAHGAVEFDDLEVLCGPIVELLSVLVFVESWPVGGGGPARAIEAVDGGVLADVGLEVLVLLV